MKFSISFLCLSFVLTSCGNIINDDSGYYQVRTEINKDCKYILHVKYKIKNILNGNQTYYFPRLIKSGEIYLPNISCKNSTNKDNVGYTLSYGISDVTSKGFTFVINIEIINNKKKTPYLKEMFYVEYNVDKVAISDNYQVDFNWTYPVP